MAAERTMLSELRASVLIDAEPDEAYECFIDSEAMLQWVGPWAA